MWAYLALLILCTGLLPLHCHLCDKPQKKRDKVPDRWSRENMGGNTGGMAFSMVDLTEA